MADVTSSISRSWKKDENTWIVEFDESVGVDDGDTFTFELDEHGFTDFLFARGYIHTTEGSVVADEAPTTAVSGQTLTVTIGGSTDNKKRVVEIVGRGNISSSVQA